MDFNLLNRATFESKTLKHKLKVQPAIYNGTSSYNLGSSVFWVKKITWRFGYFDVGMYRAKKTPLKPIEVSVSGGTEKPLLENASEPIADYTIPKAIASRIDFSVNNTNIGNNFQLEVEFVLEGVLVTPKPGAEAINLKEQIGYVMLSEAERGKMALEEAAVDAFDQKLVSMGGESIRSKMPQGLAMFKALPESVQAMLAQHSDLLSLPNSKAPAQATAPQPLQLPLSDPDKEKSALIGDLITFMPDNCSLSKEELKAIAEKMIEKGWRKI